MKKLLLLFMVGSLFQGCTVLNVPWVIQDLSHTGEIRAGMTTDEVIKIMGEPIISELENNVEEWHYCRTGALLKMTKDTFVALYFLENKLIAKEHYVTIEGYGSCENFIKTGTYKVPSNVQTILDK